MGLKAGRGNKTRGLNIFLVLTKIQGIYGSRFFYSKANQKLIPFFYESLFRKCLGGARTAPGGPGGPRFGNLAIWQLRSQTQREEGGGGGYSKSWWLVHPGTKMKGTNSIWRVMPGLRPRV